MRAPPPGSELDDLLQRFLALTDVALRASGAGDGNALAGALDAREIATRRLLELGRGQAAPSQLPAPTRHLVDAAVKANDALTARVAASRDAIRIELDRLTRDESALAGYAGSAPRINTVDVRR